MFSTHLMAEPQGHERVQEPCTEANASEVAGDDVEVVERSARRRRTLMEEGQAMEHNSPRTPRHRRLRRGDVQLEAVDGRRAARRGTRDRAFVEGVERRPRDVRGHAQAQSGGRLLLRRRRARRVDLEIDDGRGPFGGQSISPCPSGHGDGAEHLQDDDTPGHARRVDPAHLARRGQAHEHSGQRRVGIKEANMASDKVIGRALSFAKPGEPRDLLLRQ